MVAIQRKQISKLTKDQELECGALIQRSEEAKKALQRASEGEFLSEQEKRELSVIISRGEKAAETLIAAHINMVVNLARKYKKTYPYAPELEECVQDGMSGLVIAARKYNPQAKNKFSTMAHWWIKQAISRGANSGGKLVRLPENRVQEYSKISKIEREMLREDKVVPREEIDRMVRSETGLSQSDLTSIRNAASAHYSLNKKIGSSEGEGETELLEVISETSTEESAEQEAFGNVMRGTLEQSLRVLEERDQHIVLSYFGIYVPSLDNHSLLDPKSVKEYYGITSRIYKTTLEKSLSVLRSELHRNNLSLQDFLG